MRRMTSICMMCLLASPALGQDRQLVLSGANLWALDPETFETTVLATVTPALYSLTGAASGPLYGVSVFSGEIGTIDLETGTHQPTAPFPGITTIGDLHFISETEALVFQSNDLVRIDVTTGATQPLGLTGVSETFMTGIVGRSDGQIVVTGQGDGFGVMYSVDPMTWVATPVNPLINRFDVSFPISMETVGDTTYLLGGNLGRDLYTIDLFTGSTSLLATLDTTPSASLSSVLIPSPATVPVMGAGALFGARRRRTSR